MKADFFQPRFNGPRFEEHTLPLEFVKDLESYELLVIELAKYLFLEENPERQRVPKGFSSDFHLHLSRLDDGSVRPLLSLVTAGALVLGDGVNPYFERSRDLIAKCVSGSDGHLPEEFPKELLVHFNKIGRSLHENESMEFPAANQSIATLTPTRRKQLVLAIDKVYEQEIELIGTITEADWEKNTFRLKTIHDNSIVIPMNSDFHENARKYGGNSRHLVTIKGIGTFDSWDRLQKVISVESIDVQPDFQLNARFEELGMIQNGWLDGHGCAPENDKLQYIASNFIGRFPAGVPLPIIVPTPDGNLLIEWPMIGSPSVDITLSDFSADFHMFNHDNEDIEQSFSLVTSENWTIFFKFLNESLGQEQA